MPLSTRAIRVLVAILPLLAAALLLPPSARSQQAYEKSPAQMRVVQTRYYDIHSDLPDDDLKEAMVRMTRMFEEYRLRTRGFSGDIRQRLPFYLFRTSDEYFDAGGLPGSAGCFNGTSLMAIAGEQPTGDTWRVVQHEGFHQFAAAVIRGELPTWLNEGIAEYFGHSVFTGDGFVSGVIPPGRLKRVQNEIRTKRFKSIKDMMFTRHAEWNNRLLVANYDQAWSMVHFLAQGDNGRYQASFVDFMRLIGRGVQWPTAWQRTFGDASGFEARWREWWLSLPSNPTADLYTQAQAATMTGFLGRAAAQKQRFDSFDDFLAAAKAGTVKTGQTIDDWLPPRLLQETAGAAEKSSTHWSLARIPSGNSQLLGVLPNGTRIVGAYTLRGNQFAGSAIDIDDTPAIVTQAQSLIQEGKRDQARSLLKQAIRTHPRSPAADDARKLIRTIE